MNKILKILPVVLMICIIFSFVFADALITGTDIKPSVNTLVEGSVPNGIKKTAKNVWATVVTIVQILSVACIVFAGLRYMFASADQKADVKQGLIYLTIGAVIVFGATLIIQTVAKAAEQIL